MESFYFLVPIALIFVAIALRFLFWAINSGQYDNLDTEAHRILFEDDADKKTKPGPSGQDLPTVDPLAPDSQPLKPSSPTPPSDQSPSAKPPSAGPAHE